MLEKARPDHIQALQHICCTAYALSFGSHWTEGGLSYYLEAQFNLQRLEKEITGDLTNYFFITQNQDHVGFIKLCNDVELPGEGKARTCEIEKFYVLPKWKGKGIGAAALTAVIDLSILNKIDTLFLCVLDTNIDAIRFYKKAGFKFHSKTRLEVPYFKDELRGMDRMVMSLGIYD